MSERDDQDLAGAFEALRAPRSTATYAHREPRAAITADTVRRRWPQALAGVLTVLLAVAGAGTFLALRNDRQGAAVPASSSGNPPARTEAAMAFDSTAGVTVMFGGTGASGTALHDTWLWNGSFWSTPSHGGGPGHLLNPTLSDDPADGGVLLLGVPEVAPSATGGVTGCSTGSSGSGSAGGTSTGTAPPPGTTTFPVHLVPAPADSPTPSPVRRTPSAPASAPPTYSVTLIPSTPVPPATLPPPSGRVPAPPTCSVELTPSTSQTWLFTAAGWHQVAQAARAAAPEGAQLAYDVASRRVLAVTTSFGGCGLRLVVPVGGLVPSQVMCPMQGGSAGASNSSSASSGTGPTVCTVNGCSGSTRPCPEAPAAAPSCANGDLVTTWVWGDGLWTQQAGQTLPLTSGAVLVGNGSSTHASLLATQPLQAGCPTAAGSGATSCAALLTMNRWTWSGSAWVGAAPVRDGGVDTQLIPLGGVMTQVGSAVVAMDTNGETWSLAAGSSAWTREASPSSHWSRTGEAVAEGPGNTLVLFGGVSLPAAGSMLSSLMQPGSDTWRWDGHSWTHVSGSVPAVQAAPSPCPAAGPGANVKLCIVPPGVPSSLPAPVTPPGSAPAASAPAMPPTVMTASPSA